MRKILNKFVIYSVTFLLINIYIGILIFSFLEMYSNILIFQLILYLGCDTTINMYISDLLRLSGSKMGEFSGHCCRGTQVPLTCKKPSLQ